MKIEITESTHSYLGTFKYCEKIYSKSVLPYTNVDDSWSFDHENLGSPLFQAAWDNIAKLFGRKTPSEPRYNLEHSVTLFVDKVGTLVVSAVSVATCGQKVCVSIDACAKILQGPVPVVVIVRAKLLFAVQNLPPGVAVECDAQIASYQNRKEYNVMGKKLPTFT